MIYAVATVINHNIKRASLIGYIIKENGVILTAMINMSTLWIQAII